MHTHEKHFSRTGSYQSSGSSSYSFHSPPLPLTQKGTWIHFSSLPYSFASSAEPTSILNQFTPMLGHNRLIIVVTAPATVTVVTVIIVVTSPSDANWYFCSSLITRSTEISYVLRCDDNVQFATESPRYCCFLLAHLQ